MSVEAEREWRRNHNPVGIREGVVEGIYAVHARGPAEMSEDLRSGRGHASAHHIVGRLVRLCLERDCRLSDLPLSEFQAEDPALTEDLYNVLGVKNAIAAFKSYGSTAPAEVAKQVESWKKRLNVE